MFTAASAAVKSFVLCADTNNCLTERFFNQTGTVNSIKRKHHDELYVKLDECYKEIAQAQISKESKIFMCPNAAVIEVRSPDLDDTSLTSTH